jgi:hypothetical protein
LVAIYILKLRVCGWLTVVKRCTSAGNGPFAPGGDEDKVFKSLGTSHSASFIEVQRREVFEDIALVKGGLARFYSPEVNCMAICGDYHRIAFIRERECH